MTPLRTKRLRGEPAVPGDLEVLRQLHGDPRAAATLSESGVVPAERTRRLLELACAQAPGSGLGLWLFHDEGGRFVGYCGLLPVRLAGRPPEVQLLYAVMPPLWRQGFAREMAAAVLEQGFAAGLAEVVAFTLPHNTASRRVMEGQGVHLLGVIEHAGLPHVLYRRQAPAGV